MVLIEISTFVLFLIFLLTAEWLKKKALKTEDREEKFGWNTFASVVESCGWACFIAAVVMVVCSVTHLH